MNIFRVLVGTLFCLAAVILIVFFVSLSKDVGDFSELGSISTFQLVFALALSPLTAMQMTPPIWSVFAALAVGGLIGGLVSKSPTGGLLVGLLSCAIILILFMGITLGFDFNLWVAWVQAWDSSIVADLALCAGIMAGIGAIGGKLTAE